MYICANNIILIYKLIINTLLYLRHPYNDNMVITLVNCGNT